MNDNAQKLYIPVNVLETHDLVPGMGGKEFAAMGIAAAIGVVISILIYAINNNLITWHYDYSLCYNHNIYSSPP